MDRVVAAVVVAVVLVVVSRGPMVGAVDARLRPWRRTISNFLGRDHGIPCFLCSCGKLIPWP